MKKTDHDSSEREEMEVRIKHFFGTEYEKLLPEAAYNPDFIGQFQFIERRFSPSDTSQRFKEYRNMLERDVIGQMLTLFLTGRDARKAFQELAEGSRLGDLLPGIYRKWDRMIKKRDIKALYEETEDLREEAAAELAEALDPDSESYHPALAFLNTLMDITSNTDFSDDEQVDDAMNKMHELIQSLQDEEDIY